MNNFTDKVFRKIISFPKTRDGTYLFVGFLFGLFVSNAPFDFIKINWLRYILSIVVVFYIFALFFTASDKPTLKKKE